MKNDLEKHVKETRLTQGGGALTGAGRWALWALGSGPWALGCPKNSSICLILAVSGQPGLTLQVIAGPRACRSSRLCPIQQLSLQITPSLQSKQVLTPHEADRKTVVRPTGMEAIASPRYRSTNTISAYSYSEQRCVRDGVEVALSA